MQQRRPDFDNEGKHDITSAPCKYLNRSCRERSFSPWRIGFSPRDQPRLPRRRNREFPPRPDSRQCQLPQPGRRPTRLALRKVRSATWNPWLRGSRPGWPTSRTGFSYSGQLHPPQQCNREFPPRPDNRQCQLPQLGRRPTRLALQRVWLAKLGISQRVWLAKLEMLQRVRLARLGMLHWVLWILHWVLRFARLEMRLARLGRLGMLQRVWLARLGML